MRPGIIIMLAKEVKVAENVKQAASSARRTSGKRIGTSASDDAAGLDKSEKMRSQFVDLFKSSDNAPENASSGQPAENSAQINPNPAPS